MSAVIPAQAWLFAAALALLAIGLAGLVVRRSFVGMLVGLGLAWVSVGALALVFALFAGGEAQAAVGGGLALCTALVCVLQIAVGLALVVARIARRGSLDTEDARLLEG